MSTFRKYAKEGVECFSKSMATEFVPKASNLLKQALDNFKKCLTVSGNSIKQVAVARVAIGLTLLSQGRVEQSIEELNNLLANKFLPDQIHREALCVRATAYKQIGNIEATNRDLAEAGSISVVEDESDYTYGILQRMIKTATRPPLPNV